MKKLSSQKTTKTSLSDLTFIDLFAGIGGFHQALQGFGAKCVFASEWDEHAQATYRTNYGIMPHGDITKIKEEDIPSHDILCGGFPCQAFSISGKQLGFEDARGTLFFDVARIVKYHKPKLVLLENVKNFASHDEGRTLKVVVKTLQDLGYAVHYKVLNSGNYGSAQKRERIYILGIRNDLAITDFEFPAPLKHFSTVADVLEPANSPGLEKLEVIRPDTVIDPAKMPVKSIKKTVRVGYVNKGGQGERIYHPHGQAITLSAYGGGAGAKTGLYYIDGKVRKLSPLECSRLLGLPSSFKPHPNKNQAYKQFGNSVVVNVLTEILKAIDSQNILKGGC